MSYGTNYQESELILAAGQDDHETVNRILSEMLPGERASLARAADWLSAAAVPGRHTLLAYRCTECQRFETFNPMRHFYRGKQCTGTFQLHTYREIAP